MMNHLIVSNVSESSLPQVNPLDIMTTMLRLFMLVKRESLVEIAMVLL